MDWLDSYSLGKATRLIRKFLIELASLESEIVYSGFHVARSLEDFESATAAMDEFPEMFSSIKRHIAHLDEDSFLTLDHLEKNILLVEQISLINLKLQMSRTPPPTTFLKAFTNTLLFKIPSSKSLNKLFEEESISLERTIVNCDKLISTLKIIETTLRNRDTQDDELFKPSRIKESYVIDLINKATEQVESSHLLTDETRKLITAHLAVVRAETQSNSPKWQNIIGSLMVVAAITSGLADAPGATKTLQSLIQYIVGASVIKPEQISLPAPARDEPEGEGVDFFSGIRI